MKHSTIDPEKSTVIFEDRIETLAYARNSPGGAITLPACDVPVGLVGTILAAINASCNPLEALEIVYPAACAFAVVNCRVPGSPSPLHVPPVTFTASVVPVPATYT